MGVLWFYLDALPTRRQEVFKCLLSLHEYVQEKDSAIPNRVHWQSSQAIADIVFHYVKEFRENSEFMQEVNDMVNALRNDQLNNIPRVRDEVLIKAHRHITFPTPEPPLQNTALSFRTYLLNFITQIIETENPDKTHVDNLKEAVSSQAIIKVRGYLEGYSKDYVMRDPKPCLKFIAAVCTLLSKMANAGADGSVYEVIGEAENVIFKYMETFHSYETLLEAAVYEKSLMSGNNQAIHN